MHYQCGYEVTILDWEISLPLIYNRPVQQSFALVDSSSFQVRQWQWSHFTSRRATNRDVLACMWNSLCRASGECWPVRVWILRHRTFSAVTRPRRASPLGGHFRRQRYCWCVGAPIKLGARRSSNYRSTRTCLCSNYLNAVNKRRTARDRISLIVYSLLSDP